MSTFGPDGLGTVPRRVASIDSRLSNVERLLPSGGARGRTPQQSRVASVLMAGVGSAGGSSVFLEPDEDTLPPGWDAPATGTNRVVMGGVGTTDLALIQIRNFTVGLTNVQFEPELPDGYVVMLQLQAGAVTFGGFFWTSDLFIPVAFRAEGSAGVINGVQTQVGFSAIVHGREFAVRVLTPRYPGNSGPFPSSGDMYASGSVLVFAI